VGRLYGLPNGKKLISTGTHDRIEVHGPYNWASGMWPAVNGDKNLPPTGLHAAGESHCTTGAIGCRGWGAEYTHIPLTNLSKVESGLGLRNAFSSEGGTVAMSSFESMSPTLAKQHWSLHGGAPPADCSTGPSFGPKLCHKKGEAPTTPRKMDWNVMAERNYPCDDLILTFFGNASVAALDEVGEAPFKRQLYQCQLSQALLMSQTLSVMRLKNWAPAYPQSSYAGTGAGGDNGIVCDKK
jgi:beta-mannosidase